jgi:hypothetical protein
MNLCQHTSERFEWEISQKFHYVLFLLFCGAHNFSYQFFLFTHCCVYGFIFIGIISRFIVCAHSTTEERRKHKIISQESFSTHCRLRVEFEHDSNKRLKKYENKIQKWSLLSIFPSIQTTAPSHVITFSHSVLLDSIYFWYKLERRKNSIWKL